MLCQGMQWGRVILTNGWLDPNVWETIYKGSIFCRAILVIFTFDNLFKMIMPLGKGLNYFVKLFFIY